MKRDDPRSTPSAALDPTPPGPDRRGLAMLLMIISSISISFGGLVVRSMETNDPWQISFFRAAGLIVAISIVMLALHGRTTIEKVRKTGAPGLLGGAFLAMAGLAFLQALTSTTVANTLFTMSAIPFITAALAWAMLREAIQPTTLLTMIAAAVGVAIMTAGSLGAGSAFGNLMALVTAFCFSGFAIIVRQNRQIDMLPALIASGLIILIVSGVWRWGAFDLSMRDILLCLLLGGALSGLANVLFIAASRHLAAAELTLFMLLEFALGPIWVWLVVNEAPTSWTLVGGALVILAVAVRAVLELKSSTRLLRGRPSPM